MITNTKVKKLFIFKLILILGFFVGYKNVWAEDKIQLCDVSTDVCYFGDDYDSINSDSVIAKDELKNNSCIYKGGNKEQSWITDKTFICIGEGLKDTKLDDQKKITDGWSKYLSLWDDGYNPTVNKNYEGWVVCDKSAKINHANQLVEREVTGEFIKYKLKNGKLPNGCQKCGSESRRGVAIDSCPGWFPNPPLIPADCTINTSGKFCNFGEKKTNEVNKNCAKAEDKRSNRKFIKVGSETSTYFCNSEDKIVKCTGKLESETYEDIFAHTTSSGSLFRDYINFKFPYISKCKLNETVVSGSSCNLLTTSDFDQYCNFGPYIQTKTNDNCAQPSEVIKEIDGKFIYCAPDNVKIQCDKKLTYKSIFSPTLDKVTDKDDYTNSRSYSLSSTASKSCKVFTVPTGCNVSDKPTASGECRVPLDCYTSNKVVPFNLPSTGDKGGLYCISSNADPRDGVTYFCPFINPISGKPYNYNEITIQSGTKISLGLGTSSTLISTSECQIFTNSMVNIMLRKVPPLSPLGLIKNIASFLYYFAIFYFIVLILINAFSYVRSGEDPSKLKQINESLFNTIAGFIFVLASGGVILYIINSFQ